MNGYCSSDYVLAGVGRLHEVLGGSIFSNIAGLAPVSDEFVDENVDLKEVIEGKPNSNAGICVRPSDGTS